MEAGTCRDLEQHVRQVDLGQTLADHRSQASQAFGLGQTVEAGQDELLPAAASLEAQVRVARQMGGYVAVGTLQAPREVRELGVGIGGAAEGAADRDPCCGPRGPFQETAARIGEADAGRDEDLATLERSPEALEDGEDVGAWIDPAAGVEDVAASHAAHGAHGSIAHGRVGPARLSPDLQSLETPLCGWETAER
jgi:hypothetical protein